MDLLEQHHNRHSQNKEKNDKPTPARRKFMVSSLAASALAATLPAQAMFGDKKPKGEITGILTINFSEYPALNNVGGSASLDSAKLPGTSLQKLIVNRVTTNEFVALSATCTHAGCAVGDFGGTTMDCPCHGSQYNVRGQVVTGPAAAPLSSFTVTFTPGQTFIQVDIPGYTAPPPTQPTLSVSSGSLNLGGTAVGSPVTQQFTLNGTNLTAEVIITATEGYGISTSQSGTFSSTLTIQPTNKQVQTTVFVRLLATTSGTFKGQIICASSGASPATVNVDGTVAAPSASVSTGSLAFGTLAVGASAVQQYTVQASNLASNLVITAPTGFSLGLTQNGSFSPTLTLTPSGGQISATTIFVRFTPTNAGTFTGGITHTTGSSSLASVSVSGTAAAPSATVSPTSLDFGSVQAGFTFTVTYMLSASNLSGTLTIVTTGDVFVGLSQTGEFLQSLSISPGANNAITGMTIFAKFSPSSGFGTLASSIIHSANGVTLVSLPVKGTATKPVSVETIADERSLVVYPNPTTGEHLLVEFTARRATTAEYRIYTTPGQEVLRYQEHITAGNVRQRFIVEQLPRGLYHLHITLEGQTMTVNFLRQ